MNSKVNNNKNEVNYLTYKVVIRNFIVPKVNNENINCAYTRHVNSPHTSTLL